MSHFSVKDLQGKVIWDSGFVQITREHLEKFIIGYINREMIPRFGKYLVGKWFENDLLQFQFTLNKAIPIGGATGKSFTVTVEVIANDSDILKHKNRMAQVLTIEVLHAFMRYAGMNDAEENVENVIAKSNKFVDINLGFGGPTLQGYKTDIWYNSNSIKGYHWQPAKRVNGELVMI